MKKWLQRSNDGKMWQPRQRLGYSHTSSMTSGLRLRATTHQQRPRQGMDRFVPRDDGSNVIASEARQSMPPWKSSHLERRAHAHLLQGTELLLQLCIFGVGGQALGSHGHGACIVAYAAQHAHPLASSHGLSGVDLQGDQLFKSSASARPVVAYPAQQAADDRDVFTLRQVLKRLLRQQICNGLPHLGSFN